MHKTVSDFFFIPNGFGPVQHAKVKLVSFAIVTQITIFPTASQRFSF